MSLARWVFALRALGALGAIGVLGGGLAGCEAAWQLARRGLKVLRVSRRDLIELARVAPMCVADFLNERFESPLLVEAFAAPAPA